MLGGIDGDGGEKYCEPASKKITQLMLSVL